MESFYVAYFLRIIKANENSLNKMNLKKTNDGHNMFYISLNKRKTYKYE